MDATAKKQGSRGLFALVIAAFFLPFFNVTCAEQTLVSVTGVDMVIGGEADFDQAFVDAVGEDPTGDDAKVDVSIWAVLAAVGAVLGLIGAIRWVPKGVAAAGGLTVVALVVLWVVETNTDLEEAGELATVIAIEPAIGWLIALIAASVATGLGLWAMRDGSDGAAPPDGGFT